MKKYFFFASITALLLLTTPSCKSEQDTTTTHITISNAQSGFKITDLLSLSGFTILSGKQESPLQSIHKIIFKDGKIIVLDNEADFQQIAVFDGSSGQFLNTIGRQSESAPDGFGFASDLTFGFTEDNICALDGGKMSFMHYNLSGNYQSTMPNGLFGNKIECRPGGNGYLVYNEYGANDISGQNHLLFFDKSGNLERRRFPYHAEADGNSYEFTGFISQSNHSLWFSPPFCDTIYSIEGFRAIPRYTFDFGRREIPRTMINRKSTGWDFDSYAYLCEGFAQLGKMIVFQYYAEQKINYGLYNEVTESFYRLQDADLDYLYELLILGEIFPKDAHTFAFVVKPDRLRYLLNSKKIDFGALSEVQPELAAALQNEDVKEKYLILYLTTKR